MITSVFASGNFKGALVHSISKANKANGLNRGKGNWMQERKREKL